MGQPDKSLRIQAHQRPPRRRSKGNRRVAPRLHERLPDARTIGRAAVAGLRRATPALLALGAAAVVAGGLAYGYHWLTHSSRFELVEVDVRGNARRSDAFVLRAAGIELGDNLFRVDTAAAERALERDPWIARAEVKRRLPDQLVVDVTEREAAVVVELDGLYLADRAGHVFKRAAIQRGEGNGLPVVTGLSRADYAADPAAAEAVIRDALRAVRQYYAQAGRPAIGEVHVDARRGLTLHTYDTALAIRVGPAASEQLAHRLRAFDAAWSALDDHERQTARVVYADNDTHPDRVTVGFRED